MGGGPGFSFKYEKILFPSGHSALAFSLAMVIASKYKGTVIPIIAYITAVLTALSRVHDKKHWASDIFLGSVIGFFLPGRLSKKVGMMSKTRHWKPFSTVPRT
jgi:hypothetical protein